MQATNNNEWKPSWGVNGLGVKHYLCDCCEIVFGAHDRPEEIKHECTGERYSRRDALAEK